MLEQKNKNKKQKFNRNSHFEQWGQIDYKLEKLSALTQEPAPKKTVLELWNLAPLQISSGGLTDSTFSLFIQTLTTETEQGYACEPCVCSCAEGLNLGSLQR